MKFYITKYALTQGIIEVDGGSVREVAIKDGRLLFRDKKSYTQVYCAGEWYTEKGMAVADAEHRKQKKIASLKKQISKLEAMQFSE